MAALTVIGGETIQINYIVYDDRFHYASSLNLVPLIKIIMMTSL